LLDELRVLAGEVAVGKAMVDEDGWLGERAPAQHVDDGVGFPVGHVEQDLDGGIIRQQRSGLGGIKVPGPLLDARLAEAVARWMTADDLVSATSGKAGGLR
jgi:hypothetical protein